MDYMTLFREKHIENNEQYPHNDIGVARLFYDLHSAVICYVVEAKTWYTYTGKFWKKDEGGLYVMEMCKGFSQAFAAYANALDDGADESKAFIKYAAGYHSRRRRESLLSDARSIAPKSLNAFDRDRLLLNLQNGTFDLRNMTLRKHSAADCITKIARTKYAGDAVYECWEQFIAEIMCGDTYTARYLNENPVEFRPDGKIFINTNHLPNTADDTVFTSGRVKLIPFDRHFTDAEQDNSLKKLFRKKENMSGILNWLIAGYRLLLDEGLSLPERVKTAIEEYRLATDGLGTFVSECLDPAGENRIKTSELRNLYNTWAKRSGYPTLNSQAFVGELRSRYTIKPDCKLGNVLVGYAVKKVTAA